MTLITIRLLTFDLGENLVESTYGLDPRDAKSGRVQAQGPGGKRRLWV